MRHGTLTVDNMAKVIDALGLDAAKAVAANQKDNPLRYGPIELGQLEAFLNIVLSDIPPDERVMVIQEVLQNQTVLAVTLTERLQSVIDRYGIFIKQRSIIGEVCRSDRDCRFSILSRDHFSLRNLEKYLADWVKAFGLNPMIKAVDLDTAVRKILQGTELSREFARLNRGAYDIVLMPRLQEANNTFEKMLKNSWILNSDGWKVSDDVGMSSPRLTEFRYGELLTVLKQKHVLGLLFPQAFQGWSVRAQREMIQELPSNMSLAGPLTYAAALAVRPTMLTFYSSSTTMPRIMLSAVHTPSNDLVPELVVNPQKRTLKFDRAISSGVAFPDSCGGLFVCL